LIPLIIATTGVCQYVEDSMDCGGAWVGSLCYNSRAGVVYGASEDGVCFAISCDSNKVIAQIPARGALSVCYDSLDNKAYCVTQGGSSSDSVLVINGSTHTRIGAIPVWWAVRAIWNPDNDRVYVSTDEYNKVVVIDCHGDSVLCEIAVGQGPIGLTLNRRHQKLYVRNWDGESVSVLDLNTNQVIKTIPVGTIPECGWFGESADKYYVGGGGRVVVIDGSSDTVVGLVSLPSGGAKALTGSEMHGRVLAGSYYSGSRDSVAVIDLQGDSLVTMLGVGRLPRSLVWSSLSDLVYCANAAGNVSVIAGDGTQVLGTLAVGAGPSVLLAASEFKRVYVGHYNTRLVYVVRDTVSGISEVSRAVGPRGAAVRVFPNPFGSTVSLVRADAGHGAEQLAVYAQDGRLVKRLSLQRGLATARSYVWDGRDECGRVVEPGVYYAVPGALAGSPAKLVKLK
jgi:YVTN family beta-propeller protein